MGWICLLAGRLNRADHPGIQQIANDDSGTFRVRGNNKGLGVLITQVLSQTELTELLSQTEVTELTSSTEQTDLRSGRQ